MPRTTRRSLKTLQHTATDTENLVGRPSKSLKHHIAQDTAINVEIKKKNVSTKETQVNLENKISAEDLTNPDGASERYWQILAEKRQVALQEALDENEKLRKVIEDLKQENLQYKQMLDEANSFVEVIKEELANSSKDDTGIDVNDVSTADETTEEDTNNSELSKK
ncbi:geminin-like [Melitaea cinxia]|uniref:geminin-like n=1 Tax=Melitaea cinxia TaxID=113334 RepID=UPI001E26F250|nr:geminin-like [Melitaea cinxia]XP_045448113.1 geminin-like [Melitaea cinxia]